MKVVMTKERETLNKTVYSEAGAKAGHKLGKIYVPHAEAKKLGDEIEVEVKQKK